MKKIQVLAFSLLLFAFANVNATTIGAIGDNFSIHRSISAPGGFLHSSTFTIEDGTTTINGSAGFNLNFSGMHSNLIGALFVVNESNANTVSLLLSGNPFSETAFFADGIYTMSIMGLASGDASYDLTVSAVPLPAAALLFGSALLGFVGFSSRRKSSAKVAEQGLAV